MPLMYAEQSTKEWFPANDAERQDVLRQMECIVSSPPFRNSKRYPMLLRYIIERTLEGTADSLKERTVGVEVFQRTPDYDTNADNIVRITAGEVRRRIAQYYHDPGHEHELRIDLPSGSYVAHFHLHTGENPDLPVPIPEVASPSNDSSTSLVPMESIQPILPATRQPRRPVMWWALSLLGLFFALFGWWFFQPRKTPLDLVWDPLLSSHVPIVVSLGEPNLVATDPEPGAVPLTVGGHLLHAEYMTLADVKSLARITSLLDAGHHAYRLEGADETSFADLRQGPTVLLGGFDNPWTIRALNTTRFTLKRDGHGLGWIEDRLHPENRNWVVDFHQQYAKLTQDYAIVARFHNPETQQPVLIIAGVGGSGSQAASEFLTESEKAGALSNGNEKRSRFFGNSHPNGLAGHNFEVVLGTQVINGVSGAPQVLAKEVW